MKSWLAILSGALLLAAQIVTIVWGFKVHEYIGYLDLVLVLFSWSYGLFLALNKL